MFPEILFLTISFFFEVNMEKHIIFLTKLKAWVEFEEVCKLCILIGENFSAAVFSYLHIVNSPISFRDSCKVTKLSIKTKSKDKYSHSPKLAFSSIIDQFLWEPHFFCESKIGVLLLSDVFPRLHSYIFLLFTFFPPLFFLHRYNWDGLLL